MMEGRGMGGSGPCRTQCHGVLLLAATAVLVNIIDAVLSHLTYRDCVSGITE